MWYVLCIERARLPRAMQSWICKSFSCACITFGMRLLCWTESPWPSAEVKVTFPFKAIWTMKSFNEWMNEWLNVWIIQFVCNYLATACLYSEVCLDRDEWPPMHGCDVRHKTTTQPPSIELIFPCMHTIGYSMHKWDRFNLTGGDEPGETNHAVCCFKYHAMVLGGIDNVQ